jgi:hypothetical protein
VHTGARVMAVTAVRSRVGHPAHNGQGMTGHRRSVVPIMLFIYPIAIWQACFMPAPAKVPVRKQNEPCRPID